MFQIQANKILGVELFDLKEIKIGCRRYKFYFEDGMGDDVPYYKFCKDNNTILGINRYKEKTDDNISFILKLLSYQSSEYNRTCFPKNIRSSNYIYTHFKEGVESIPKRLQTKIYKSIPNGFFQNHIDQELYEHMLRDDYPLIYKAMGYLITFDIAYLSQDLSTREIQFLSSATNSNIIIIDLKKSKKIKLIRLKGKKNSPKDDKSIIKVFPRTPENVVYVFLYAAYLTEHVDNTSFEAYDVSKLIEILKLN